MTKLTLTDLLFQEIEIFKNFGDFRITSSGRHAFYSGQSEGVAHWNALYPGLGFYPPDKTEVKEAIGIYQNLGRAGFVILKDSQWHGECAEESEYFILSEGEDAVTNASPNQSVSMISDDKIEDFCQVVREAFDFDKSTYSYFLNKMNHLFLHVPAKFFVLAKEGHVYGTGSIFCTPQNYWFLFNVAVLEAFRGCGCSKELIGKIASLSPRPLAIYSHNPVMRNGVLPQLGFRSMGAIKIVELTEYEKFLERE